jgi:hypothetical protein
MRVAKFSVRDFLSLRDTGEISLDPAVTLLLGKNEEGKSNVLLALESFDRESQYDAGDLCRYSETRRKVEGKEVAPSEVPIVTVLFEMEPADRRRLKEIDRGLADGKTVEVTKYLDNHYVFAVDGTPLQLPVDAGPYPIDPFVTQAAHVLEALRSQLQAHAARYPPFAPSLPVFDEAVLRFNEAPRNPADLAAALSAVTSQLAALQNQDQPIVDDVQAAALSIAEIRQHLVAQPQTSESPLSPLLGAMPRFVYFDDVDLLQDTVAISDLISNPEEYKTLRNLMSLTGLDVERLGQQDFHERREQTNRASAHITGLLSDSWTQENVEVTMNADGPQLGVTVADDRGGFDPPSERSKGFQWYLGFYINFNAGSQRELRNTVLLLDDPGVYLHASGQKDLLKIIETLAANNQFVIATHSPFLIDTRHLERIRIVEKPGERKGTRVKDKWHESDLDALAPIRACLGMTIGDSLIANKENLVVEGLNDFFILSALSRICQGERKPHLDLDRVALLPVGGAPKVPYWTMILYKQHLKVAALLDHDSEGRKAQKCMVGDLGIDPRLVMTLKDFAAADGVDVELEDLLDPAFYHAAFQHAYAGFFKKRAGSKPPALHELPGAPNSRVSPYVEYFKSRKLGAFDKAAVAKAVQAMCAGVSTPPELGHQTIETFAHLFQSIRGMLAVTL